LTAERIEGEFMDSLQLADLIPWINIGVLILATILMFYFYMQGARPAQLEKKIGPVAYQKCGRYRVIASLFELIAITNYIVYYFYPLPIPIPQTFPWSYWISVTTAVIIGVPCGYIMLRGVLDAGEAGMLPKKNQKLFGGIYTKIRHPQAMGELPLWWVMSLLFNSPFLALYSIVWIPIFIAMCLAEEKDLLLRYGKKYALYQQQTGFIIPKRT
jgi:protein-S-isoprenylcysteine O-methyltransferase Ste14